MPFALLKRSKETQAKSPCPSSADKLMHDPPAKASENKFTEVTCPSQQQLKRDVCMPLHYSLTAKAEAQLPSRAYMQVSKTIAGKPFQTIWLLLKCPVAMQYSAECRVCAIMEKAYAQLFSIMADPIDSAQSSIVATQHMRAKVVM